jgi:ribosome-associated protein
MIRVTDSISLSEHEIEEHFIRAPGPGGQNVNKVASAVHLRLDAANSPALSEPVLRRLRSLAGSRMTREGVIVLTAYRFRSQDRNRQDALERLITLIRGAATPPKQRRPTKPSAASRRRGFESKRRHGELKKQRRKSSPDED